MGIRKMTVPDEPSWPSRAALPSLKPDRHPVTSFENLIERFGVEDAVGLRRFA